MSHYKSNLRDIEFNLFEVFRAQERLGSGPYADMDVDTARTILEEVERLAVGPLAASFVDADRHPPVYDAATASVTLPDTFKASFKALMDSGFWASTSRAPRRPGRAPSCAGRRRDAARGQPTGVHVHVRPGLRRDPRPPRQRGAEEARAADDRAAVGRHDGAHRARRRLRRRRGPHQGAQQADGSWQIEGVKRFISNGDHDIPRTSSTWCSRGPKARGRARRASRCSSSRSSGSTRDRRARERNGVYATNIENKMGIKARPRASSRSARRSPPSAGSSATCTTASHRCSTSSSTRAWASAPSRSRRCRPATSTRSTTRRTASRAPTSRSCRTRPRRASRSSTTPTCAAC